MKNVLVNKKSQRNCTAGFSYILLGLGIRLEGKSKGKVRWSGYVVAPIWRDNVQVVGRAAWGALLRERKVTGRDASLPAPLLLASLGLVALGTVGALPQTQQGALPLDPARGNPPLTPSRD